MRNRKKGSLELSINAIVVLVLAITMLGLGIAFTKGKFSELGSRIEIPEPDLPATADDPISLPANEIKVSTKKDTVFTINVYNDGLLPPTVSPDIECDCTTDTTAYLTLDTDGGTNPTEVLSVAGQSVPNGADAGFKIIVPQLDVAADGWAPGISVCVCTIQVLETGGGVAASKQINFKVT